MSTVDDASPALASAPADPNQPVNGAPASVAATPPPVVVSVASVGEKKTPLINVHEEAEHLYPALWGSQILLQKRSTSADSAALFAMQLFLPVGTHLFKFCVDGAWQYDPEVAFAPDEYGNLNNFIKIMPDVDPQTKKKLLQRAIRTIIRDASEGLPVMNPVASEELMKLRLQTSPVLRPQRSPVMKPLKEEGRHDSRSAPTPMLTPLTAPRKPQDAEDSEYGLRVGERHLSNHNLLSHNGSLPRSRAGTLIRSKSEESLGRASSSSNLATADADAAVTPKYSNYLDDAIANSVLLAATTQHFGGDLVTHEHSMRAQLGGHRSVLVSAHPSAQQSSPPHRSGGKLIIFLVGLPGRGKTFIGHILARHLTWMGHKSRVFNTGEYRRRLVGSNVNHAFWDPLNEEAFH
ncbi:hypothetical protein BBJ28_00008312, partial [Nothophytophthora sp. Chile5]